MNYEPGAQVIVLDTTGKPVGSAEVQRYHPEAHSYTVLFHYPGTAEPESIQLPALRLLTQPGFASES